MVGDRVENFPGGRSWKKGLGARYHYGWGLRVTRARCDSNKNLTPTQSIDAQG